MDQELNTPQELIGVKVFGEYRHRFADGSSSISTKSNANRLQSDRGSRPFAPTVMERSRWPRHVDLWWRRFGGLLKPRAGRIPGHHRRVGHDAIVRTERL